jgi:glycosyltransferase involved in cell wall biosynthesis
MNRIAYVQYTNPGGYPPLQHSSRLLADDGWKVMFLGTQVDGVTSLRVPSHSGITVRCLATSRPGWKQKLHYLWFVVWAAFWTLVWRSRWVYASDPLSCPVALLLSYVPGLRVIYHEHDAPSAAHSFFGKFVLLTRLHLARRAKACALPNGQRAEQFLSETDHGARVRSVWNCPSRDEVRPSRPPRVDGQLLVYYHGNIGPAYVPVTLLQALAQLPSAVSLRVIGYETAGTDGYVDFLTAQAEQLGIRSRVDFRKPMSRDELLPQCSQCDVGIALMPTQFTNANEMAMAGASNKPFDYLACGLALLVSDLPDWRAFYVEAGCALAVDPNDAGSIAKALRWLLEHPDERRGMGERGRQHILADWNYETQFEPVFELFAGKTI